ncbi:hypothetical protein RHSIM_Rhsim01G0262800 [Rhododendron simsii]|uniref:Rho termination factor-like N-terminal domain-containing protein n=1 Tax=Rhododendron simsii TaxID=118357 RepID=A0A834LXX7_RHOSS|nr:hypothetical protein RHSIM_Rhsim01G0262800 [Rhododendron simsii]
MYEKFSCMVLVFVTGYGPIGGRCFSCSEASVRAASLSPCSSRYNYKAFSNIKIVSPKFTLRGMSLVCKAGSNGFAGNLEFSRQNKHGFSQSKNKQNGRDNSDSPEEARRFLSKIGPLLSGSSASKFQPNGTPPEPRKMEEKDNVFGKLKAKLPPRANFKKEKAAEGFQGHGDEDRDVRAAIDLVRKHISQIGEACNSNGSSRDDLLDQSKQDGLFDKEENMSSPKLASKRITPMGNKSSRNDSSRDFFLDKFETLAGSSGKEKSTSSPQLARKRITPMGRRSSSSNDSSRNFLDQIKRYGLFDEEKSVSSPKLAGKFIPQTGRKSISNGSSRDFLLDQSEQGGVIDEEKSTSSFDSSNPGELESPFLKLLNKHDTPMGKNSWSKGSSRDFTLDRSAQNGSVNKEKSTASFDSNDFVKCESPTLSRPVSNFRRRSPIPRVKFELICSDSFTDSNLDGKRGSTPLEHEKREDSSDFVVGYSHNEAEQKQPVEDDLSAMKLPELKALAKSRGMKGLSRLRKHQLLELLSSSST